MDAALFATSFGLAVSLLPFRDATAVTLFFVAPLEVFTRDSLRVVVLEARDGLRRFTAARVEEEEVGARLLVVPDLAALLFVAFGWRFNLGLRATLFLMEREVGLRVTQVLQRRRL